MQNAAQRMQVLIQDLLKLSRVTSRAQPFQPCDLAEIVQQVLSDLEIAIEQKQARVEVGTLPTIDADPLQMRQLFQNLIANALKFQKPGDGPEVVHFRARLRRGRAPCRGRCRATRFARSAWTDNGIGFDAKFAEQIFVVFQRLHTREEYSGTGIGLAVCRKITDRHGGTIMAKSAQGQGASFIMTLPVKQPIAPAHDKQNHGMPITILMADDDPDDRLLTREALEEGRLINDIRFVEHGEELLDYLRRQGKYAPPPRRRARA